MNGDAINGAFELGGAILIWLHIRQLHKDKQVKGVHWGPVAFYAGWGFWNLWYYPSLDQWLSFWAGIGVVFANTVWLLQMLHYRRKQKHELSSS